MALAYVARGKATLVIVSPTEAIAEPKVRLVVLFPDRTQPPNVYPAALTKDARPGAKAFLDFLSGSEAAAIFTKAGFVLTK